MKMRDLIHEMVDRNASDLHVKVGSPPGVRIDGVLAPIEGRDILGPEQAAVLIDELLDDERREIYERERELDFSKHIEGVARFRVNIFHQRGSRACVMRMIPIDTPELEEMGFPDVLKTLCRKPRGLILVTGPTGSGKSTTLAAMIDYINRHERGHILTLEDPIEFIHHDKKCFVNQREIGSDSRTFSNALRAALREDPDFILVGELRDLETMGLAITAAETGHLVMGTLHTTSAIQTVDRIIDVFPHEAQQQVRMQLSVTLQGVISQTLMPRIGGGRACAMEIMTGTDAVRSCIREGKTPQLLNILQTGAKYGMQTLESCLAQMVREGKITPDSAVSKANKPDSLRDELERSGVVTGGNPAEQSPPDRCAANSESASRLGLGASTPGTAAGATSRQGMEDFEHFRARRRK